MRKVLIANRGEIAKRIVGTLRTMGIASVAVYSDADAEAPHVSEADEAVRIGPPPSRESYLDINRILEAATRVGADALHPGYGFLAESAEFAERCGRAGLTFIGPPVEVIRKMGSKIEAKKIMEETRVPVIPGVSGADLNDAQLAEKARGLGFPLLVKASAGGGGRGMRIVREVEELPKALAGARREAGSAFGDETLLIERYIEAPRHIEVQIFGDAHGRVIHCFERECSIQRRYQKVVEEAPSVAVDAELRKRLGAAAVAAGEALGYVGAGTVEFLLDADGEFYFLEVNTRLQVEHPVTEAITGLDLVRLQVLVAEGAPLPVVQEDLTIEGHAIEARLYAEDPARGFLPATGTIALWQPREIPGVRYDSGVVTGTVVGAHYDPLLAKIISHGPTRREAIERLTRALRLLGIGGLLTNREFLVATLTHPAFERGELDTHFVERHLPPEARLVPCDPATQRAHAIAAALHAHDCRSRAGSPQPSSLPSGWRNNRWRPQDIAYRVDADPIEVHYVALGGGRFTVESAGARSEVWVARSDDREIDIEIDGVRRRLTIATADDATIVHGPLGTTELRHVPRFPAPRRDEIAGGCAAPMPGVIREVRVKVGEHVERGTVLLILEAMKMEHQIIASDPGVVKELRVEVGQMVEPDAVLIVVEADE
jgi:acetyl-CoA carboxylase biotin carboxylase subunit